MSWFNAFRIGTASPVAQANRGLRPIALGAILLASGALLGACSFQPVYSGTLASQPSLDLAFAKPGSRLEQIIYQDLALRLGSSQSASAPLARVSVSSSSGGNSVRSASSAATDFGQTSVTATLVITQPGETTEKPLVIRRTGTAQYTTSGQVLADTTALAEANERAAKAAAESLRLGVLAALIR